MTDTKVEWRAQYDNRGSTEPVEAVFYRGKERLTLYEMEEHVNALEAERGRYKAALERIRSGSFSHENYYMREIAAEALRTPPA